MKRFLIILFLAFSLSGFSQNFFWSHTNDKVCFGYLYNGYAVEDSRKITSSDDWFVPSWTEYRALSDYLGGGGNYASNTVGDSLKAVGNIYWDAPSNGQDSYGFNARGTGWRLASGGFASQKGLGYTWTSQAVTFARLVVLFNNTSVFNTATSSSAKVGAAVHLIKDATGLSDGITTTYTGTDLKTYNAVVINELYWTTESLEEILYRNGDTIPNILDNTDWSNLTTGAWCVYDNNEIYKCK